MANLSRDLWYAFRLLGKRPAMTSVALVTLALGFGANTAVFSMVNGVLLKPLPYPFPDRLIHVTIAGNTGFGDRTSLPMADFLAWQAVNRSCETIAVYTTDRLAVSGVGEADEMNTAATSAGFFRTLGIVPALGRVWRDGDDAPGAPLTVVLSYRLWQERFHAIPDAIARTLVVDGRPHEIIGVAPPGFAFPEPDVRLWRIQRLDPPTRRGPYFLRGLGRLNAGASVTHVRADLTRAVAEVRRRFPSRNETQYRVEPLDAVITGDVRPALLLLDAAVTLVLIIAIGNIANLLLVSAAERERELAVRAALGAARRDIVVQLFIEGAVLAGIGAVAAWTVALWATRAVVAVSPADLPRIEEIQMDAHVFAFTLVAAVLSAIVFGCVPAFHVSDSGLLMTAQSGARTSTRPAARRFRNGLIVGEIALALTVAVMAALLAKSLLRLQHVPVGVTAEHVLTASVTPPAARYPRERVPAVFDDLLHRIETIPGVVAVGLSNSLPPDGLALTDNFVIEDRLPPPDRGAPVGPLLGVSTDYFRTLGISLLRGRSFNQFDTASSMPVAVISEAMAKEHFAGLDPVGRRIKEAPDPQSSNPWHTVIGIVADVKYAGLAERADPALYLPLPQLPLRFQHLVVRTTGDPAGVVREIRDALHVIDPDLPLGDIRTLDARLSQSAAPARFRTGLMGLFGAMGLLLAAVGTYGVIAYSVTQRTRELGVRVALGATRRDVLRMIIRETLQLVSLGTVIGLALALVAGRSMAAVLFEVSPFDSVTLISMSALLALIALGASAVPAWRAATTDPVIALRAE